MGLANKCYAIKVTAPDGSMQVLDLRIITATDGEYEQLVLELGNSDGTPFQNYPGGVVRWTAQYQYANDFDRGYVDIGEGERRIPESLQDIGLGSLLMSIMVIWSKSLPIVPVDFIFLAEADAATDKAMNRRNWFWEKFGFKFSYMEDRRSGSSLAMTSDALRAHDIDSYTKNGWSVEVDPDIRTAVAQLNLRAG